MAIYILRHLGVSRREAGLMPRWERDLLVTHHKAHLGVGRVETQAQAGYSASDVEILMTPGVGG